jgi:hypothetical protein
MMDILEKQLRNISIISIISSEFCILGQTLAVAPVD